MGQIARLTAMVARDNGTVKAPAYEHLTARSGTAPRGEMRAAGERPLLAAQRGIDFQMLFALSWAPASLTAGVAGILYASNVRLDPGLGELGLKAFAVASADDLPSRVS